MTRTLWIVLAVAAALLPPLAWVQFRSSRETVSAVRPLAGDGARTALVSYDPGLSDFQEGIALAFARGLADAGWRVEVTTTSRATPAAPPDLDVDLLVLGANTYWWAPDPATRRYLKRAELDGTPTAVLVSASGQPGRALRRARELASAAGGEVVRALALTSWRPNDEARMDEPNREVARDMAYRAGLELTLR